METKEKMIQVSVKFNGRWIPLSLSADTTVKDLKSVLQPLTNLLPRGQKLIAKGKILDDQMNLNGLSKIQLIGSQGLHQGSGPIIKKESPDLRKTNYNNNKQVSVVKSQFERWKLTGVISLSDSGIKLIPQDVWNCGSSVRFLDLNSNSIEDVPEDVAALTSLQKLFLNANCITDESLSWKGLSSLKSLSLMSLSHNLLTTITSRIGSCSTLVEVDFSQNLLIELPETLSNLTNLKALHLHNNGLRSLPSTLLKNCTQLSTLDLHGTEITMDMLREFEGWESFDERRVLKHSKQLAFRVQGASSSYFDEGADKS
ncbi:plant intracellular Ras-group-related LRR protein 8 isoform X2 [Helianthus annuus]|uniref:plant intracellular Ras-group-related LRR protein 8 isoform X2 n=1 Tax=Helianthus annuus TaxID=4232 RepID=UPI000B8FAFFA|nr:plant intracellular Ras-group-related LRR protein 8 isoform X2 [Helianthus annuus]